VRGGLNAAVCALQSASCLGPFAACAAQEPLPGRKRGSVPTIDRRLAAIAWYCAQKGQPCDRADRHIREVMQGIRREHGRPPEEKEAVLGDDVIRMAETLHRDLRGLRDRAILLIGFAGGLRRSEIVGLDCGPDQTEDGSGWIESLDEWTAYPRARQDRLARGRNRPRVKRPHLPHRRP
jgi:integrase